MSKDSTSIDISSTPELVRLAEEVAATDVPAVLRRDDDVAVLTPIRPKPRLRRKWAVPKADDEAFLASAGGWKDVDVDAFLEENDRSRRIALRAPVEL